MIVQEIKLPRIQIRTAKEYDVLSAMTLYQIRLRVGLVEKCITFTEPPDLRSMLGAAHKLKRAFGKPGEL